MRRRLTQLLLILILPIGTALLPLQAAAIEVPSPLEELLLVEVQTGSTTSASEEFVEIVNPSTNCLLLNDLLIQYASRTGTSWQTKAALSGWLAPRARLTFATTGDFGRFSSGLAQSGGQLRLASRSGEVGDQLIWGNLNGDATAPKPGESLKRLINEDGEYVDTDNSFDDWFISTQPSPESDPAGTDCEVVVEPPEEEEEPPVEEPPIEPPAPFEPPTLRLSELLPNPDQLGADAEKEFIELHNFGGEPVELKNIKLTSGSSEQYSYIFSEQTLPAGELLVLYAPESHLVLSNTGSSVRLYAADGSLLDETSYGVAGSDQSWIPLETGWSWTTSVTPAQANIFTPFVSAVAAKKAASKRTAKTSKPKVAKVKRPKKAKAKRPRTSKQPQVLAAVDEPKSTPISNQWLVTGVGLAVLYLLYEYRKDAAYHLKRAWRHFHPGSSPR